MKNVKGRNWLLVQVSWSVFRQDLKLAWRYLRLFEWFWHTFFFQYTGIYADSLSKISSLNLWHSKNDLSTVGCLIIMTYGLFHYPGLKIGELYIHGGRGYRARSRCYIHGSRGWNICFSPCVHGGRGYYFAAGTVSTADIMTSFL